MSSLSEPDQDRIHPRLFANETPFGYRACDTVKHATPFQFFLSTRRNWLIAAIDPSIPPLGQITELVKLASIIRRSLRRNGQKTHKNSAPVRLGHVDTSEDRFAELKSYKNHLASHGDRLKGPERGLMIGIDTLGPLVSQATELIRLLRKTHQDFIAANGTPRSPPYGYISTDLPSRHINERSNTAGNYLKALLTLFELDQLIGSAAGYPEVRKIMTILDGTASTKSDHWWQRDFEENVEKSFSRRLRSLSDKDIAGYYIRRSSNRFCHRTDGMR